MEDAGLRPGITYSQVRYRVCRVLTPLPIDLTPEISLSRIVYMRNNLHHRSRPACFGRSCSLLHAERI